MKLYRLTERYTGEREVYVHAESKAEALTAARNGDSVDEGDPTHFNYRYVGPVIELEPDRPVAREDVPRAYIPTIYDR